MVDQKFEIIGVAKIDSAGRINLRAGGFEIPPQTKITFSYLPEEKVVRIFWEGGPSHNERKLDSKGRVCIPSWLRQEVDEFYCALDAMGAWYLLPKRGPVF